MDDALVHPHTDCSCPLLLLCSDAGSATIISR